MKTSRILKIVALLAATTTLSACGFEKVPAGNVGIKVYLLGGDKGVDHEEVGTGRYWLGWNEELYIFPTFTQNYVWTRDASEGSPDDESISFQTTEGLTVNADVGISYSIRPDMVATVFERYRRGVEEITDTYLRNMVRDALVTASSTRRIDSVYGAGKAEIILEVEARVREQVEPLGIDVERVYWVGELRLPDTVVASLNSKIEATQRAEQRRNEIEEAEAEAMKLIAQAHGEAEQVRLRSEAEAEANRIVSESLTPELIQYRALERWDGSLPRIMGGEAPVPFVDVSPDAAGR